MCIYFVFNIHSCSYGAQASTLGGLLPCYSYCTQRLTHLNDDQRARQSKAGRGKMDNKQLWQQTNLSPSLPAVHSHCHISNSHTDWKVSVKKYINLHVVFRNNYTVRKNVNNVTRHQVWKSTLTRPVDPVSTRQKTGWIDIPRFLWCAHIIDVQ